MAIIYSYPEIPEVEGGDLLLISDTGAPNKPTRSVDIDDLALYIGTVIGIGFWNLGTAPDSIFTTKMASVGQDANIASSKFNVYKTEDMTSSVPHIATFNESSSNHSANLWPSPGDNSADIYGSVSRATLTGSGTVDQIIGVNPIGRHSGSGSVNFIQGVQTSASLTGSGSANTVVASYAKTFIEGTGSTNIPNAIGAWNVVALNGLNDVDTIYGTYSNVILTKGEVNDDAIGHFINFDQVAVDTEVNNAYYIHAKNDSLSVTGEKFFIKDETGIPSQFSNKLVLNAYGSGTFTGTATQRLAVDTNGNVIEIPIGSGPVDGSGTANYSARWIDTDTLGIGALYDNGTNVGIGTTSPDSLLEISTTDGTKNFVKLTSGAGGVNPTLVFEKSAVEQGVIQYIRNGDLKIYNTDSDGGIMLSGSSATNYNMYINNSGNVGIGTTSPSEKLEVAGQYGNTTLNGHVLAFTRASANYLWAKTSGGDLRFTVNGNAIGSPSMTLSTAGNLGIGTTSPSAKLHLADSASGGNPSFILQDNARSGAAALNYISLTDSLNTNQAKIGYLSGLNTDLTLQNLVGNTSLVSSSQIKITAGTNTLFENSGSETMRITSAGNVGIGTTSPSTKLEIAGSGNQKLLINRTDGDNFFIDAQNGQIRMRGSDSIYMGVSGDLLTITNTNIGIGTTSPSELLELKPGSGGDAKISILKSDGSQKALIGYDDSNGGLINLYNEAGTTNVVVRGYGNSYFNGGNFGIGTTSPSKRLDIRTSGTGDGITLATSTPKTFAQIINGNSETFPYGKFTMNYGDTTPVQIVALSNELQLSGGFTTGGKISFRTATSEQMRLTETGLGIGTTAPSQKLHISGNMRLTGAFRDRLNSQGAANYVLTSTGSNGTQWVDASGSSIIGGPYLPLAGGTMTGDLKLNDNVVANFGNSDDLKIYHDGSNSYIKDVGSGGLRVATNQFRVYNSAVNELMINANENSSVELYHANYKKFETTSTGVSITGNGIFTGDVGIGTTSPNKKLVVSGDIKISGGDYNGLFFENASGTTKTLLYQHAGYDALVIKDIVNNADRVTFKNNGNVGIGTNSPSEKLEVVGYAKATTGFKVGSYGFIYESSNNLNIKNSAYYHTIFYTNNAERMRITNAGNVGIGTTSPGVPLDVTGTIRTTTSFVGNASVVNQVTAATSSGSIKFKNNSGVDRAIITDAGNVGIGTTSPSTKLHVNGDIRQQGSSYSVNITGGTGIGGDNHLDIAANGSYLNLRSPNNSIFYRASSDHAFRDAGGSNEYLRIKTSGTTAGNVGIGTTSPNAKLNVNGNIKIEGTNALLFGGSSSVPSWEIKHDGSDLIINDTGSNVGSVLFNNDEGVVLPRLTTTEINAISLPSTGLTVYNTTLNTLCFYNGSSWQKVSHANM